jgi:hypothetical protein
MLQQQQQQQAVVWDHPCLVLESVQISSVSALQLYQHLYLSREWGGQPATINTIKITIIQSFPSSLRAPNTH